MRYQGIDRQVGDVRAPYARPLVTLLDLLGQRWMLRIVWELRDGAVLTFRKLQERCDGVSPAVQNDRLAKLRRAGIVEHAEYEGYRLTAAGGRLAHALKQLDGWARAWAGKAARSR